MPNTFESWKQAVEAVILQIPEEERQQGKEINAMLKATRDTQLQQWLAVIEFLRDRRPDPATMRRISRKLRPYGFAYRRVRPIYMPIRNMLQKRFLNVSEHHAVSMAPAASIAANRADVSVQGGILIGARTCHGSRPALT